MPNTWSRCKPKACRLEVLTRLGKKERPGYGVNASGPSQFIGLKRPVKYHFAVDIDDDCRQRASFLSLYMEVSNRGVSLTDRLQAFVASLGYTFDISLQKQPGVWHYVQRDDFKGAYIFTEVKLNGGISIRLTVYDYKKGEAFTEKFDSRELTEAELATVEKAREALEEKVQEERHRQQVECQKYCTTEFAKHGYTTKHEYFRRKGVEPVPDGTFKSRKSEISAEQELLCPLYDSFGTYWGYQIISESGQKRFNLGQRTDGCFVPVGNLHSPKRIYICEGVATALSVFLSLGGSFPVVAALSANNLPKVVKDLRKAHPKVSFIICADNDQWAKTGNAGLRFAQLSTEETDGVIETHPDFPATHPEKPTDWNDFHRLNTLQDLTKHMESLKPVRPEHFWALGHSRGTYYFTNLRAPEVHSTKDFSTTDLLKILSLKKWGKLYPEYVKKNGLDWEAIKSELIDMAQKKGQFSAADARGVGMYLEKGKALCHLGDRVLVDGEELELQDFESDKHFYDLKPRRELPARPSEPYKQKEFVEQLLYILKGYTWENKLAPQLIIGWLYCAYASGALTWRPHVLVSAKAGSGKSTIASLIVEELLAYSGAVKKEDTTEAGARQEIENNAVPFIHDEFDTNRGEPKRLASVLNLLRAASSGGSISRGTPSGKSLRFEARFCAYLTGINPPNLNEADQTRITILRLLKQNPKPWSELEKLILTSVDSEAARGIFWQVYDTLPAYQESFRTLQHALSEHGERVGQQLGSLLAGYHHMFHVEQITKEHAAEIARVTTGAIEAAGERMTQEDNAERCFERLMELRVKVQSNDGNHELMVGQILEADAGGLEVYQRELATVGIKRLSASEVFVAGHFGSLESHFEKTQWQNYVEALLRLPNAKRDRLRVGGVNARGVRVSLPTT